MLELAGLELDWPIVGAPMAGGPTTPTLVAAVAKAGGLGFLAGGYLSADRLEAQLAEVAELTAAPIGVNLFVPQSRAVDTEALAAYLDTLAPEAERLGVEATASCDDDEWQAKVDLLLRRPVPLVSFTFGCPTPELIGAFQRGGSRVAVSVTRPSEAASASEAGVDLLVVQGVEAGGHQATFVDDTRPDEGWGLLALLSAIRRVSDLPLVAAGGLMTGLDLAAVLRAGASAAALGTALLRSPESGASPLHKAALADPRFDATSVTRAFSGRRARGLLNDFMRCRPDAPSAYPHINNATREMRRASLTLHDPHGISLWAGQGFAQAQELPAGEIIGRIAAELAGM